jgi:hypothetical protein
MEILLFIVAVVLLIRWLVIRARFGRLEQRIEELSAVARRVKALEQEVAALRLPAVTSVPEAQPVPFALAAPVDLPPALPLPPPVPLAAAAERFFCEWCGKRLEPGATCECRSVPETRAAEEAPRPMPPPLPDFVPAPAGPTLSERLRERMSGEEWEALVGGSLLNKLGVLVLVIGIALFLGYSFTQLGAVGRAAIGFAVSLAMLGAGFFVDRRERYRVFARGLLGGGWASLYFTSYAVHAVEATRVVDSPVTGGLLLLAVAIGMIVHSLRFESQTLTGLTYFVAFVTLAITPVTTLSVVALLPLAASLLYVSHRFQWSGMALFGLAATWGTLISRGPSDAPAWQTQIIFTAYWAVFEAFDLLRASRRTPYAKPESLVLPLNALAFAGLSYAKWSQSAPAQLHIVAAAVAGAYMLSALMRAKLRPPSSFPLEAGPASRMLSGGYEGPVTIAAALSAAAVLLRFRGAAATLGLLIEAQCYFVAGLVFGERYLKQLAAVLFGAEFFKLFAFDATSQARSQFAGWNVLSWTPVTALSAALFYVNRFLERPAPAYGWAASAAVAVIIGFETPERFLGPAWFALATVLFVFGWARRIEDFRFQGHAAAALALAGTGYHQADVAGGYQPATRFPWIPLSISAALAYAGVWCALRSPADRLREDERGWLRRVASWSVTALLALIAVRVLPAEYLGLGWLVLAVALLELGLRGVPADFRTQAYALAGLGAFAVAIANVIPIRNTGALLPRLIPCYAAAVAYTLAARVYKARESSTVLNLASAAATIFACAGIWAVLPPVAVGPAWTALSLVLVELALALGIAGVEKQGHVLAAVAFTRLFFANFTNAGATGLLSHRLLTVVPVATAFYYLWSRLTSAKLARYYLHAATFLVFVLLRFELGRTFTVVGWAALALAVFAIGQRREMADFRWQGYLIAAATFIRSITTNFYAPESLAGIPGRIATGVFVILCLHAAQLMIPLPPGRAGLERYARTYFSLLGAALTSLLLFHEVSGSVLTVAWGLQSILLLGTGFPLRDRTLRLTGLFLFLVCILKLFLYDLRNLETGYRILSFIVLGLMLLSVSWIYTRFRDRIQRYL